MAGAANRSVAPRCGEAAEAPESVRVAAQSDAHLVAVDIADTAVEATRARAAALGLSERVTCRVGTFQQTTLPDASADGVMSIDALLFTPDKRRAIEEIARVLRSGGRLVFTSWDYHRQPAGRPPQVDDHRPVLEAAGFRVHAYDETSDWRRRLKLFGQLLESVGDIAAETGESPEDLREGLVEEAATIDAMTRRFFAVAERVS